MCDPISAGLVAVGTGLQMLGKSQIANAQKKSIAKVGQEYQDERGRQAGYTQQQEGTVADTLNTYSRPATDQRMNDATTARQASYVAPIQSQNPVVKAPADFDPNSAVARRNLQTGVTQQAKSVSSALAKARLDAYGDAQTRGRIAANNNANNIAMVQRIARGSADASNMMQGTLQSRLEADKGAGATAGTLGDIFTTAGMMAAGGGFDGLSNSLFGAKIPVMGPNLPAGTPASYGRSFLGFQF